MTVVTGPWRWLALSGRRTTRWKPSSPPSRELPGTSPSRPQEAASIFRRTSVTGGLRASCRGCPWPRLHIVDGAEPSPPQLGDWMVETSDSDLARPVVERPDQLTPAWFADVLGTGDSPVPRSGDGREVGTGQMSVTLRVRLEATGAEPHGDHQAGPARDRRRPARPCGVRQGGRLLHRVGPGLPVRTPRCHTQPSPTTRRRSRSCSTTLPRAARATRSRAARSRRGGRRGQPRSAARTDLVRRGDRRTVPGCRGICR